MDDEQVLRSIGEDLERDDPDLAALLSGETPHRFHRAWLLLLLPLLGALALLPLTVALGVIALVLVTASPLVGLWICPPPDGGTTPRPI